MPGNMAIKADDLKTGTRRLEQRARFAISFL